jgi:phasin family protein
MMTLVRTAFHGLEQLSALNLAASRELFNSSAPAARSRCSASRTPQQLKRHRQPTMARPNVDKLMEYSRSLYDLAANHAARNHLGDGRAIQHHAAQR